MNTYIALLRGINVSGHKKIRMEDLRQAMETLPVKDVKTYIQSGNLVLRSKADAGEAAGMIHDLLLARFDFDIAVIVRTPHELSAALSGNPFLADAALDPKGHYIAFLNEAPEPAVLEAALKHQFRPDQYEVAGNNIYLHYAAGAGNTKLTNNFLEKKLQRQATSRNLNTVRTLIQMAADL